jgi:hypothetical protein
MPLAQDYPSQADIAQQEYTKKLTSSDIELIDRFQTRVDEFALKYNALVKLRPEIYQSGVPDLITRYNKLILDGNNVSNLIETASLGVNNLLSSLKRQWGEDYIVPQEVVPDQLKGLGAYAHRKLLEIAGIGLVSVISYVAAWLMQTDGLNTTYNVYRDIREKEPEISSQLAWERAMTIAPPPQPGNGPIATLKSLFPYVVGIALLWYLLSRAK